MRRSRAILMYTQHACNVLAWCAKPAHVRHHAPWGTCSCCGELGIRAWCWSTPGGYNPARLLEQINSSAC